MRLVTIYRYKKMQDPSYTIEVPNEDVRTIFDSAHDFIHGITSRVVSFCKTAYYYGESVLILLFASFGLSALLGEMPFYFTMPLWVESSMFMPVVAALIILFLVWNAQRRGIKRGEYA